MTQGRFLQSLDISSEPGDAHEAAVIDLEYSLEVGIDCHLLGGEAGVCGDRDTVLASHGNHHITIVVEDRLEENSLACHSRFF